MTHIPTDESKVGVQLAVGSGATNQEVADYFEISLNTLKKHYADDLARGKAVIRQELVKRVYESALGNEKDSSIDRRFLLSSKFGFNEKTQSEVTIKDDGTFSNVATALDELARRRSGEESAVVEPSPAGADTPVAEELE